MLAACSICIAKAIIYIEVQKYLFGTNGLIKGSLLRKVEGLNQRCTLVRFFFRFFGFKAKID